MKLKVILFAILIAGCLTPLLNPADSVVALIPPLALISGLILALTLGNPFPKESKSASKLLLQASVVLLGFSMDLNRVLQAGMTGITFALGSITAVFLLGWGLQKLLNVRPLTSLLVSTGTAICGGSAIAAMSTVTDAPQEDVSVAVGTVFLLNAVALVIFPPIGHAFHMTGQQFGVWSGIAIHDVSSVVGAATAYGDNALETATAVKLSRVLYLIPITLIASYLTAKGKSDGNAKMKIQVPWFIFLFILASLSRTLIEPVQTLAPSVKLIAVSGFSISLFLIGGGITRATLKAVGVRPLAQGIILWAFISVMAFFVSRA